ncbi:hypothetical protein LO763_19780 [Glycomyces sp. A-F 0318]|uniref:hypothetical protein n=1 Tax=Glycomyces amatae TaxID=2881355 RepID=UPI001E587151|nr:hypothetical protein [Glycomyces amatae]MCD0445853.1 hypothetical protein [Glycomyces amatae]
MTEHTNPETTAPVSDEEAASAADDLTDGIAHERDLHRQADTKAVGAFAVVGLMFAAATTVLPMLDMVPQMLVGCALIAVTIAGVSFGLVLLPRSSAASQRSVAATEQHALDRVRHPSRKLRVCATELVALERLTRRKHELITFGMLAMGFALAFGASAGAVTSITRML